jgi:hypothetical protein
MPKALLDGLGLDAGKAGAIDMTIIAKDFARQTWQRDKIAFHDWDELTAVIDPQSRTQYVLERFRPDILITATSDVDDRTDVGLWSGAHRSGIRSMAFVDHGVCLRERFLDEALQLVLPDRVFLPDAELIAEMRQVSGLASELIVCGDLHLLRLPAKARLITKDMIAATRQAWHIGERDAAILFPSEPRREIADAGRTFADYEDDCLRLLARHLAAGGAIPGVAAARRHVIVVRPHPKDTPGKYDALVKACPVPCVIDATADVMQALLSADAVVGLDSTVMFEADTLGVPVFSLIRRSLFIERLGPGRLIEEKIAESGPARSVAS